MLISIYFLTKNQHLSSLSSDGVRYAPTICNGLQRVLVVDLCSGSL
jgi:hypothetical protein